MKNSKEGVSSNKLETATAYRGLCFSDSCHDFFEDFTQGQQYEEIKAHTQVEVKSQSDTAPMKKKARIFLVEDEIEDEDSACNITARNSTISPTSSFQIV